MAGVFRDINIYRNRIRYGVADSFLECIINSKKRLRNFRTKKENLL